MKKNTIILLLTIGFLLSLSYGIYQKNRADKIEEKLSKELILKSQKQKNLEDVAKEAARKNEALKALYEKEISEKESKKNKKK